MTDKQKVLNYMILAGSISAREASRNLNVGRLSGRILELRRDGHDIETVREPNKLKNGWHARYVLKGGESCARM